MTSCDSLKSFNFSSTALLAEWTRACVAFVNLGCRILAQFSEVFVALGNVLFTVRALFETCEEVRFTVISPIVLSSLGVKSVHEIMHS